MPCLSANKHRQLLFAKVCLILMKTYTMRFLRILALLFLVLLAAFAGFMGYSTYTWYDPPQVLTVEKNNTPDTIPSDSLFTILTWNIGYAGLGNNMDFFYDGGQMVRDTRQRVQENLDSIDRFLKINTSKQFIFIQEIDVHSKRSFRVDQTKFLTKDLEHHTAFATNYKVKFVPIPPLTPMGQVNSGIMTLSHFIPESAVRHGYPGAFGWPSRVFNLRRCMLVNSYPTSNGKKLIMINTHKSAFDDGSLKKQEMQYLKDFVLAEYAKGNYVVVGGDWNQSPPEFQLTKFGDNFQSDFFILSNISNDFLPGGWKWAFDPALPTNRYLNEAYHSGSTFRCLIDFFLVSPNVEVLEVKTHNLNFRNSDHNPVSMRFGLKK